MRQKKAFLINETIKEEKWTYSLKIFENGNLKTRLIIPVPDLFLIRKTLKYENRKKWTSLPNTFKNFSVLALKCVLSLFNFTIKLFLKHVWNSQQKLILYRVLVFS